MKVLLEIQEVHSEIIPYDVPEVHYPLELLLQTKIHERKKSVLKITINLF
jgi:hypothetical protein